LLGFFYYLKCLNLQLLTDGKLQGIEEKMLSKILEYLAANQHAGMIAESRRTPTLIPAVILGSLAQRTLDRPCGRIQDAALLLQVLQSHLPGVASMEYEVCEMLESILKMAEGKVRHHIMLGLAFKASVLFF